MNSHELNELNELFSLDDSLDADKYGIYVPQRSIRANSFNSCEFVFKKLRTFFKHEFTRIKRITLIFFDPIKPQ